MPPRLTEEWIDEQLAICERATEGPWMLGWPGQQWPMARRCVSNRGGKSVILAGTDQHGYHPTGIQTEADGLSIIAAREGYPLVLKALIELRTQPCSTCDFLVVSNRRNQWWCIHLQRYCPRDWYCGDWKERDASNEA